jgi:DNA-binding NtrC family response regulator
MRLLIVNCDPKRAKSQAVFLSSQGFIVEAVSKVVEAAQSLEETNFDAVLVSGWTEREARGAMLRDLRYSHPDMSFFLLTADQISVLQEASANGSSQQDIEQLLSVLNPAGRACREQQK